MKILHIYLTHKTKQVDLDEDTFTTFEIQTWLPDFIWRINSFRVFCAWPVWAEVTCYLGNNTVISSSPINIHQNVKTTAPPNMNVIKWKHSSGYLLALCAGSSPVTSEIPSQRPVTRSVGVFFDLRLNKRLSKHSIHRRFETQSHPLCRHCNTIGNAFKQSYKRFGIMS